MDFQDINKLEMHGIPAADALMAIYASYYMGSHGQNHSSSLNAKFNLRAQNTFGMIEAMEKAFGRPESPWVVIDHRSDTRRDGQNVGTPMHGAHFLTVYHKQSQRVMVTMPGLESDDNTGDTFMDLREMAVTGMRGQTSALYEYIQEVEDKISKGIYKDGAGQALNVQGKPVIGAHSMGCTAAQTMALDGYETVLLEPRPIHNGLLNRITQNYSKITGKDRMSHEMALDKLNESTVNLRSIHSNIWNSLIIPWKKQFDVGTNYSMSKFGHVVTLVDRLIGGQHRAEMSVPSLVEEPRAKGYEAGAFLVKQSSEHMRNSLLGDVFRPKHDKVMPPAKPDTPKI